MQLGGEGTDVVESYCRPCLFRARWLARRDDVIP